MAMELNDGHIVTSKTSALLSAPAALILNALKYLSNIPDDVVLISPAIIEPVSKMKIENLGNHNPRLHADEVLIALTISTAKRYLFSNFPPYSSSLLFVYLVVNWSIKYPS